MFRELADMLKNIEAKGFKPMDETYGERMQEMTDEMGGPPLTGKQRSQAEQLLDKYQGVSRRANVMAGEENQLYGLDKETVERNLPVKEGRIDREGEIKVDVDRGALDQIEVIEKDGQVQYATKLSSNASKIPQSYYSHDVGFYDPLEDSYTGTESGTSFGKKLKRSGESGLKHFIENKISDEDLNKYGFTRQQLIDKFVQLGGE